MPRFKTQS